MEVRREFMVAHPIPKNLSPLHFSKKNYENFSYDSGNKQSEQQISTMLQQRRSTKKEVGRGGGASNIAIPLDMIMRIHILLENI